MNKKYLQYTALMILLASINPSFAKDNHEPGIDGAGLCALSVIGIVVGFYVGEAIDYIIVPSLPSIGKNWAATYEDASPETQNWAKKVLNESGINDADQIPLKKGKQGDGWSAVDRHFVIVPQGFDPAKCSRQRCFLDECSLKHEVKHVQNNDMLKQRAVEVITTPLIFHGKRFSRLYRIYHESEADRFACEHATSKQELEAKKCFFENIAKTSDVRKERKSKHPSPQDRADMVSEYIKKWDERHKKS